MLCGKFQSMSFILVESVTDTQLLIPWRVRPLQEECALSDPQGESDADADIEDTDCRSDAISVAVLWIAVLSLLVDPLFSFPSSHWFRLQEPGSLQRISSRRRKRPRVSRQDTTESEDDGGRSHRSHRWNLRLSPDRAQSRTILEVQLHALKYNGVLVRSVCGRITLQGNLWKWI